MDRIVLAKVKRAVRKALPKNVPEPQLCTTTEIPPAGDHWIHEIKFDGYRMLCRIGDDIRFISRRGKDWSDRFKPLIKELNKADVKSAIIDGEVAVTGADGITDFQALQNTIGAMLQPGLVYFAFDLLYVNGYDLSDVALLERKQLLSQIIPTSTGPLRYVEHIVGNGATVFQGASQLGVEGIVSKKATSNYRSGRHNAWLKTKCVAREDFVVVGYNMSESVPGRLGALVVGEQDTQGIWHYAGRVGSGFSDLIHDRLLAKLKSCEIQQCIMPVCPDKLTKKKVVFTEPNLVVEVQFAGRTNDGTLRHATFKGIRDDIEASDVQPSACAREAFGASNHDQSNNSPEQTDEILMGSFHLTNPDRVWYPETGITKLAVATYYAQIADWILPEIVNRPLSLVRGPKGIAGKCFFQKSAPAGLAGSVERITIDKRGEEKIRLIIHDLDGLVALVQFSAIELHIWNCRADNLDKPDRFIFDLDPDKSVAWSSVVQAALALRDFLAAEGLESFVKTTGGKGLHLVVPIARRHTWEHTRNCAKAIAERFVAHVPRSFTLNSSLAARTGKIYLDVRAGKAVTSIAPYSTRARAGAPISMPIAWHDLPKLQSGGQFTIENLIGRLKQLDADPWADLPDVRQSLPMRLLK